MEILALAGLLLSLSPFGLVVTVMLRQMNKKRRLEDEAWVEPDNNLHSISHVVEIPQIPANFYPPQLTQNSYYYINNEMECETPHHLDVGEQYKHDSL
ncbi:hypothetical protein [Nostoc sp. FACHB-110]|uniref:hypothetical protein n=1 Tax=Nostoc sp. FACHB-110 TaxID=2692834 RepID=UPI001685F48A|nr:hypothetical protein [Nostoc sp. FACHB-110]MBD2439252.1 hypothetical protein [Nostoc sp. FACHB-110]